MSPIDIDDNVNVDVDVDDVDEYISLDGDNNIDNSNDNNNNNDEDSVMFIDATQDLVEDIPDEDNDDDESNTSSDDDDDEDDDDDDEDDDDDADDDSSDDNDVDSSDDDDSDTDVVVRNIPAPDQDRIRIPSLTNVISTLIGTAVMSSVNGLLQRNSTENSTSSTVMNNRERRRTIQQIMANTTLTEQEKRIQIQQLMMNNNNNSNNSNNSNVCTPINNDSITNTDDDNNTTTSVDDDELENGTNIITKEELVFQNIVNNATKACTHYERNCVIISPCCQQIFGCRICHDEKFENDTINTIKNNTQQQQLQQQQQQQQQQLSKLDHVPMNRYLINEIICTKCYTRQSCIDENTNNNNNNECNNINCKIQFGQYYCSICNLWMSLNKQPFHCNKCGFCRVGNKNNYIHCNQCNMCIAKSTYTTHICSIDKYNNNCPICHDNMFTSRISPQELLCGHTIHTKCYNELIKYDYRCPICKKSFISRISMIPYWSQRANEIQNTPLPLSIQRTVSILCIDCDVKSTNCSWHVLGIQCPSCSSFNTVVDEVTTTSTSSTTDNNNASPST